MIFKKQVGSSVKLPKRATKYSAGYDFYMPFDATILPNMELVFSTEIESVLDEDKVLIIVPRSSLGRKGLVLENTISVIDSDYHKPIQVFLKNEGASPISLKKGDRFCQGIIIQYFKTSDDEPLSEERIGGIGSTGLK